MQARAALGRVVPLVLALAIGAPVCGSSTASSSRGGKAEISARIRIPGRPFSVAAGEGFVWVVSRSFSPTGCSARLPCKVFRIDPESDRIVGKPIRLPAEPWFLAVGGGSVWVTQFDGRLIRIDARTGRISARISARPVYFGSVVTFGGGFVWTGNDDERYKRGSTAAKVDPATNRVVGKPLVVGSAQSLAFGHGALWDADHSGWLLKIDPATFKVVARRRLAFGPHGVAVTDESVFIADAHGDRLLEADPETLKILRIAKLSGVPIYPAVGAGSIWSGSSAIWGGPPPVRDDRVVRIDPATLKAVETLHVGGNATGVAFGFESLWAALPHMHQVVRITPR